MFIGKDGQSHVFAVAVGTPVIVDSNGFTLPVGITVALYPGGTLLVEYRLSTDDTWHSFADGKLQGTQASYVADVLVAKVNGLRFTAATADGTVRLVT